jgi:outer membrane protein assembly factor BamB
VSQAAQAMPRRARTAPCLALAVLLAGALMAGCGSKGKAREPTRLKSLDHPALEAERVWSRSVGDGSGKFYSNLRLALREDALFAASVDGEVCALNPKNGEVLWRTRTKARFVAGPAVAGDQVLLGTLDGEVYAFRRADGKEQWHVPASSEVLAPPAASGNTIVVKSSDGRVTGLDIADGSRKWAFDRGEPSLTLRDQSAPLILGSRVYLGMDNGKIAALNLADGDLVWEQTLSTPTGRGELDRLTDIDADLLEAEDGLYAVTYGGDIALIDLNTGDSRWRRSIKSYTGMALGGDRLYVTDDDGLMWSLDAGSGAANWKQDAIKYRRLSPPAVINGYAVAGDFEGYLHFFAPGEGTLAGRARVSSSPVITAPVVGNGLLYVMDAKGRIRAFEVKAAK